MPNGNINSDALDSLFDPKGNVVLEQFEDSAYGTTAVLLRPESAAYRAQTGLGDPYVVAYGYDKETGEWSHGYYTSDLSYAFDRANPEILEEATIKWQREDFEAALEEGGFKQSKKNLNALINKCFGMKGWKEVATQHGNEAISDALLYGNLELERNPKLAIDGKAVVDYAMSNSKEKPGLDSSQEPKEYGIDQLMADLSNEAPETGEDNPGGRD